MAEKLNLNLALQPSTASTDKIQIQFSRHGTKDFFGGFLRKIRLYNKNLFHEENIKNDQASGNLEFGTFHSDKKLSH